MKASKIDFFFTNGHSYTATGVDADSVEVYPENSKIVYRSSTVKNDITTFAEHHVPMHDLKFAVVYLADGATTSIIHGLVKKFNIDASYKEALKVREIEREDYAKTIRAERRRIKESEKFITRRAKRAEERKEIYVSK